MTIEQFMAEHFNNDFDAMILKAAPIIDSVCERDAKESSTNTYFYSINHGESLLKLRMDPNITALKVWTAYLDSIRHLGNGGWAFNRAGIHLSLAKNKAKEAHGKHILNYKQIFLFLFLCFTYILCYYHFAKQPLQPMRSMPFGIRMRVSRLQFQKDFRQKMWPNTWRQLPLNTPNQSTTNS